LKLFVVCAMSLAIIFIIFLAYFFAKIKKGKLLWHRICLQNVGQLSDYTQDFIDILPKQIDSSYKYRPSDFTRDRHLPFAKLITFTLHLASSGTHKGVDVKSGDFFKNARRSGLWLDAQAVHRSSVSKARSKVPWQVFSDILNDAVQVAYRLWPEDDSRYMWHGMSVYALDGSKYNLPASDEIREKFDPQSGLQYAGKGHYPQCLVSTVYDVFRRFPIARTVVASNGSEREELEKLIPFVPPNNLWLFDRGYPAYGSILTLTQNYRGKCIFRSPASSTFPAVEKFVKSGKEQATIWITPSNTFKRKVSLTQRIKLKAIKLRIIRLESPDGTVSVLLTNLFGNRKYKREEIIQLYFRRWEVENYYRDEKVTLDIEKFHSKNANGILQELYAVAIMSVISRTLMALCSQCFFSGKLELQFKNAIMKLSADAALLVPDDPQTAAAIFKELLAEISRVKYYRPKKPRPPQPRVNKGPVNKWNQSKIKKSAANAYA